MGGNNGQEPSGGGESVATTSEGMTGVDDREIGPSSTSQDSLALQVTPTTTPMAREPPSILPMGSGSVGVAVGVTIPLLLLAIALVTVIILVLVCVLKRR